MGAKREKAKWRNSECCSTCKFFGQIFYEEDYAEAFGKDFCKLWFMHTSGHKVCKDWLKK